MTIAIALFQPDIPQNTGTIARLCACMGSELHIIEPAGFPVTEKAFRRAGMDYIQNVDMKRHMNFDAFLENMTDEGRRVILVTTKASLPHIDYTFKQDDVLLFGRESSGVPEIVHQTLTEKVTIPMKNEMRSLNLAVSAGMLLNEALRQTKGF